MQQLQLSRPAIVEEARRWIGTPYQHQGRSAGAVDCLGLCFCVYSQFIDTAPMQSYPDIVYWTDYDKNPDAKRMGAGIRLFFEDIPKSKAQPGDMLWMRILREPQHVGIFTDYLGRGLIHANSRHDRVQEQYLDGRWWGFVVQAFRLKGLD